MHFIRSRSGILQFTAACSLEVCEDETVQIAVHHGIHIAGLVVGAVILDHGVGHEHIAADLVAPGDLILHALDVADLVQVLLLLDLIQLGSQHLHGGVAVLELAALGLAADHDAGGLVDQAHRAGGLVDVLAARAGGAVDLHLNVLGADLDVRVLGQVSNIQLFNLKTNKVIMSKNIIVIGSCNTDMVIKADRLPVPGETIIGGSFMMNPGGKGANQAVAAARLKGNVHFIAKTGNDLFGKRSIEQYEDEGIHVENIYSDPTLPSGVALIMVDMNGENSIAIASGANGSLSPEDIRKAQPTIEKGDILLMQLEIPIETVEYAAQIASEQGIKVILNPAPARALSNKLLQNLYMIIPNETEAEILSGIKVTDWESARKAADIISAKGVDIVVITLGSKGALIKEKDTFHEVPVPKVKAVDTTAAGDTFCGALCVALSEDVNVLDAVKFANKCASITVTRMGAQPSLPYRKEIDVL